jgi:organic radical activating enzyme
MPKFSERFFCPAPWTHMYHHVNNTTPCHANRNSNNFGPDEYLNSEWLKNLKQDFINGTVPETCKPCKDREDQGLKSTRGAMWGYSNVGEEPEMDISQYTMDTPNKLKVIELRSTNLCNFKCRMCSADSSSDIAKEQEKFSIPIYVNGQQMSGSVYSSPESHIEELKKLCVSNGGLRKFAFTGGEPFLIKEYYSLMDFLIEQKINETIELQLYTNCSVYNTKFIDRLTQFTKVNFVMSIDGVEKTAEYQRHGTNWRVVKENVLKFNLLPFNICFNTAITSYVLLDVSSLAKFLMELYNANNNIQPRCYSVVPGNPLHHRYMSTELKNKAINEIDQAVGILTAGNFEIFVTELKNIKTQLQNTEPVDNYTFKNYTTDLDTKRNESFKDVFGCDL